MRFRRSLGFGLCAACGVLAGVPAVRALPVWQEYLPQGPAFRVDVDLVLLPVAVLDPDGRPVTDLSVEEFRVYEDGELQHITHFLAPDDTPLDVALVLDSSASLAPWARVVRTSAKTFLQALEVRDCVVLVPFSGEVAPGYWALAPDPTLSRRIDALFRGGSTALYDAVHQALVTIDAASTGVPPQPVSGNDGAPDLGSTGGDEPVAPERRHLTRAEMSAELDRVASEAVGRPSLGTARRCGDELQAEPDGSPQRRRALVLLTDGADKNSQHRFDEVLALAQRKSVPVFPVVMGEARNDAQLRAVLDALAGNTGGAVIEADSPAALRQAYDDVVVLLRASYLLGYLPRDDDKARSRHEIRVRSRRASYRLVHRTWYFR